MEQPFIKDILMKGTQKSFLTLQKRHGMLILKLLNEANSISLLFFLNGGLLREQIHGYCTIEDLQKILNGFQKLYVAGYSLAITKLMLKRLCRQYTSP